ncbi:MAG: D-glycero-beta-D-manno-heptose-7-phosphate kinase [Elusimicrobia bacterium]|nr:D-glycero-beta-D-manno-heptose-7-phosphate kinase [Elusimicrobiota bacterium]
MANGPLASARKLNSLIDGFGRRRILVLGDLMLDQFIQGSVSRISPEAPVPVVQVSSESSVPGGAGNVCNNLAALGARVAAIGLVGTDEPGRRLLSLLRSRGVETQGILEESDRPTTQKCRVVADHQQVVRFDRERSDSIPHALQDRIAVRIARTAPSCQALILSDYGKGIMTPFILNAAIRAARRARIPVTVDPKVEHFKRYRRVDCLTPNLQEAWGGMRMLPKAKDDEAAIRHLGTRILTNLRTASVLITRGEKGMTLFENRSPVRVTHIPARAREVFDVTGAGDTVISVLTLALACGANLRESALLANWAAGIAVGKLGTATVTAPELKAALKSSPGTPRP